MPRRAVIVSTSHWDRAWYVPFQEFRWALVELLDQVLELLERDDGYEAFMLDGQTIVLEDYLELRPERRETVARLIAAGRLQVGPWYVPPDEYLVSREALIRNLLVGTRLARSLAGRFMEHGYNPDSFGHVSQLPQILRGFGRQLDLTIPRQAAAFGGLTTDPADRVSRRRPGTGGGNPRDCYAHGA